MSAFSLQISPEKLTSFLHSIYWMYRYPKNFTSKHRQDRRSSVLQTGCLSFGNRIFPETPYGSLSFFAKVSVDYFSTFHCFTLFYQRVSTCSMLWRNIRFVPEVSLSVPSGKSLQRTCQHPRLSGGVGSTFGCCILSFSLFSRPDTFSRYGEESAMKAPEGVLVFYSSSLKQNTRA